MSIMITPRVVKSLYVQENVRGIDCIMTFFDFIEDYRKGHENIQFGLTLPLLVLGPILSLQLSLP